MEDFALAVGAIASALSLVAGAVAVTRYGKQRRIRHRLDTELVRLLRIDRRLVAAVTEVDRILAEGVGWHGFAIPPPKLLGHLDYLDAQINELDRSRAQIRSLPTRDANDRLRETIETVVGSIRAAFVLYRDGTWTAYREHGGEPVPVGATGREPVAAMEVTPDELVKLRGDMELAVRTAAYQLGRGDLGEHYECRWPVIRADLEDTEGDVLWRGEPRPVTHREP
jgi:hypothetical protein